MASQPDIVIEHVNASYILIRASEAIRHELSDFYTLEIPGAKFMPGGKWSKHSKGSWDGKIRLYSKRHSVLPSGLLQHLKEEFVLRNGYTSFESQNNIGTSSGSGPSRDKLKDFINELKICAPDGSRIICREDQLDAIEHCLQRRRTLILSPTASGKTLIGYVIYRWLRSHDRGSKGLVIVPRIQLVKQLFDDWRNFSKFSDDPFTEKDFRLVYGGGESLDSGALKNGGKNRIDISTWQSIYKLPADIFEQYTFVLGDEAHEFKAKSLSHIMNSCVNAYDRFGLTGTLDGTNTHKLVLEGLFGPARKIISSRELMDKGHIAKLNPIKVLVLKHPDSECKTLKRGEGAYEDEIKYLISSEARNKFISKLGLSLTGNSLILFQRVETHGKILYDMMCGMEPKRKVFFIHGGIDTDIREEIRRIVEKESSAIIVASYGTFSTGINIRNLHNVVFASPSKSRIRNLQSIGRGLRIGDAKDSATLFDIADDLRPNSKGPENFTYKHMEDRLKIYIEEKFPYKIFNIEIGIVPKAVTTKVFS